MNLGEALKLARTRGKRSALGAELFEKLMEEGQLYAATSEGYKILAMFNTSIFFSFWKKLDHIKTTEGKEIKN